CRSGKIKTCGRRPPDHPRSTTFDNSSTLPLAPFSGRSTGIIEADLPKIGFGADIREIDHTCATFRLHAPTRFRATTQFHASDSVPCPRLDWVPRSRLHAPISIPCAPSRL